MRSRARKSCRLQQIRAENGHSGVCALLLLVQVAVSKALASDETGWGAFDIVAAHPTATFSNGYGYIHCPVTEQLHPTSTAELAAAIKNLHSKAAAGQVVKVRATHEGFGSSASFPCPVEPNRPGRPTTTTSSSSRQQQPIVVGALMDRMSKVLSINHTDHTMRIQASMLLGELYSHATAVDMSVPLGLMPAWAGLTVAGVLTASAHGSGYNTTSVVCDIVKDLTWIDGRGDVHVSARHSEAGRGLCSGLGLMGIITELTLQLQPTTHTEVSTWYLQDDKHLWSDVKEMLKLNPRLLILWRPDIGKYSGYMLKEVPPTGAANENAVCTILPSTIPFAAKVIGTTLQGWEADINNRKQPLASGTDVWMCSIAVTYGIGQPWSSSNGKPILQGTVLTNKAQSVDCGDDCAWTSPYGNNTIQDLEFTIKMEDVPHWISDVKKIIDRDLQPTLLDAKRCLPPGFFVLRFGQSSPDLLSTAGDIAQPVYVQQITMRHKQSVPLPSKYEWVQEAYEQLTLCKYNGRPHWGKCFDRTFTHPTCSIREKYGNRFTNMLKLQARHDPLKIFEPELFSRVVSAGGSEGADGLAPGCVIDRTCYCVRDEHCAPGFRCVGSKAFPEYKVCKSPKFV